MCSTESTTATNGVLTQLANGVHWVPIQDTWQAVHKVHRWMVCSLSGAHTWPSWKQHVNVRWLTRCGWSGMLMQTQSALVEQMHCQGESSMWISSARQGLWVWSSVYQGTQLCVYWHAMNKQRRREICTATSCSKPTDTNACQLW